MVLYIHHAHFIVFFSMFLFHEGILCTEYSADDMSHGIQRYKMEAMHRGNISWTKISSELFYVH
jgi:hypothetical protein